MDVEIYEVKLIGKGRLYVMPCPKVITVEQDLARLRAFGVDKIISLLESQEADMLGVAHENVLCERLGIDFEMFPIPDHKIPTNPPQFRQLINTLHQELQNGRNIAVHCFAGIGRTGVLAGGLLIKDGMTAAAATEFLSDVRGCHVPQTHSQSNYLIDFENGDEGKMPPPPPPPTRKKWLTRWLSSPA